MPDGRVPTRAAGWRLDGVDATGIDDAGGPPMPAARLDPAAAPNQGVDAVRLPTVVCRLAVGAAPMRR